MVNLMDKIIPVRQIPFWTVFGFVFLFLASVLFLLSIFPNADAGSVKLSDEEKLDRAQKTLILYFTELHDGDYAEAASHYSGSYQLLELLGSQEQTINKSLRLREACEQSGFDCLRVMEVVSAEQMGPHQYRFEVTFEEDDGTLYRHLSRDGAFNSIYPFTVEEIDGQFYVINLPIHS